ncbi:DUF448 domain-containing protein [Sphingoaurantiacus capsulatus]|uniref:DUF448 domain-containing protein n=1 Tax=Sphingoaurantiacus capsulatus TaxID=1771310 RepID=A0ABV7XDM6_9SPHN
MPEHETPERKCILSAEHGARDDLIRLALGPDGDVLPDLGAKAPGRGAWVTPDRRLIEAAVAKGKLRGALLRAFKGATIKVPDDLVQRIEAGLQRRALDRLGLELRTGNLMLGSDRILDKIRAGRVHLLLHAADASADGRGKLDQKLRVSEMGESVVLPVGRSELSVALGRENVVHAALCDRAAATRVAAAVSRWRAFCGTNDDGADGEHGSAAER